MAVLQPPFWGPPRRYLTKWRPGALVDGQWIARQGPGEERELGAKLEKAQCASIRYSTGIPGRTNDLRVLVSSGPCAHTRTRGFPCVTRPRRANGSMSKSRCGLRIRSRRNRSISEISRSVPSPPDQFLGLVARRDKATMLLIRL